ncbi:response regulator, partial [Thermodesulfobacteriota bacterium]
GFDLILMDWQMPGMDGIETARKILNDSDMVKKPKIIMVTGHGRSDVMKQADDLGLDGLLLKPVTQSLLLDAIMEAFGHVTERPSSGDRRTEIRPEGFEAVRGAHILLVEDNEINQQVATELLKDEGFFMDIADNGKIAVEKVMSSKDNSPYDVVLMDLQMPVMDGYAAAQEIRKDTRFDNLPIVAMTADAMSGVREKVLDIGMNDYVTKPIDPRELFGALAKWVKPGERVLPEWFEQQPKTDIPGEHFPDLPGIDVQNGIMRVGGNIEAYKKILNKFIANQGDADQTIRHAMDKNNMEEAVRLAHTLKGVSGNIGAGELHESAEILETFLKDNRLEEADKALAETSAVLRQTLVALKPVSATEAKPQDISDVTVLPDDFLASLNELIGMLEQFNSEAEGLVESLLLDVKDSQFSPLLEAIQIHLGRYDFEGALSDAQKLLIQASEIKETGYSAESGEQSGIQIHPVLPEQLLRQLKQLLTEFNGEAETVLDEILMKVKGTEQEQAFRTVQKKLGDYDFEGALGELESVIERFYLSLKKE